MYNSKKKFTWTRQDVGSQSDAMQASSGIVGQRRPSSTVLQPQLSISANNGSGTSVALGQQQTLPEHNAPGHGNTPGYGSGTLYQKTRTGLVRVKVQGRTGVSQGPAFSLQSQPALSSAAPRPRQAVFPSSSKPMPSPHHHTLVQQQPNSWKPGVSRSHTHPTSSKPGSLSWHRPQLPQQQVTNTQHRSHAMAENPAPQSSLPLLWRAGDAQASEPQAEQSWRPMTTSAPGNVDLPWHGQAGAAQPRRPSSAPAPVAAAGFASRAALACPADLSARPHPQAPWASNRITPQSTQHSAAAINGSSSQHQSQNHHSRPPGKTRSEGAAPRPHLSSSSAPSRPTSVPGAYIKARPNKLQLKHSASITSPKPSTPPIAQQQTQQQQRQQNRNTQLTGEAAASTGATAAAAVSNAPSGSGSKVGPPLRSSSLRLLSPRLRATSTVGGQAGPADQGGLVSLYKRVGNKLVRSGVGSATHAEAAAAATAAAGTRTRILAQRQPTQQQSHPHAIQLQRARYRLLRPGAIIISPRLRGGSSAMGASSSSSTPKTSAGRVALLRALSTKRAVAHHNATATGQQLQPQAQRRAGTSLGLVRLAGRMYRVVQGQGGSRKLLAAGLPSPTGAAVAGQVHRALPARRVSKTSLRLGSPSTPALHHLKVPAASRALSRSLANARARQAAARVANTRGYCPTYCRTGSCPQALAHRCPHLHDPSKVAVCSKWLMGGCADDKCALQHKVVPDLMPVCSFFLKGTCLKSDCPYLHVRYAEAAPVCQAFLRGVCPRGAACPHKHFTVRMAKEAARMSTTKPGKAGGDSGRRSLYLKRKLPGGSSSKQGATASAAVAGDAPEGLGSGAAVAPAVRVSAHSKARRPLIAGGEDEGPPAKVQRV